MTDYPALFKEYVVRSAQAMRDLLDQPWTRLPDEVREQALHTLDYALQLDAAWPAAGEVLCQLAPLMEKAGYRTEWLPYLSRGLAVGQAQQDAAAVAELTFQLGLLSYVQGLYDDAHQQFATSAAQWDNLEDCYGQVRALNRLAGTCRLQHRPAEAQTVIDQTLVLLDPQDPALSHAYLTRGLLAYDAGRFAEAEADQRRCIALAMLARDPRLAAWGLVNLGVALRQQQREEETLLAYRLAAQLFVEIDDVVNLAAVRMNIGNVYLMRDEFEEALRWYNLAEPVFRQTEDRYRLSDIYQNRGIAQRELGHLAEARADFARSLAYHRALDRVVGVAAIADALGLVDLLEGDEVSARAHFMEALDQLASIDAQNGPRGQLVKAHLAQLEDNDG